MNTWFRSVFHCEFKWKLSGFTSVCCCRKWSSRRSQLLLYPEEAPTAPPHSHRPLPLPPRPPSPCTLRAAPAGRWPRGWTLRASPVRTGRCSRALRRDSCSCPVDSRSCQVGLLLIHSFVCCMMFFSLSQIEAFLTSQRGFAWCIASACMTSLCFNAHKLFCLHVCILWILLSTDSSVSRPIHIKSGAKITLSIEKLTINIYIFLNMSQCSFFKSKILVKSPFWTHFLLFIYLYFVSLETISEMNQKPETNLTNFEQYAKK